jgi:EAL domain-containing protein (putative c-di-GMP-specific phosphodiesterase class I)
MTGVIDNRLDDMAIGSFADSAVVIGLTPVAEIVESAAVPARPQEIGVDYAQGLFLHDTESFEALLTTTSSQRPY